MKRWIGVLLALITLMLLTACGVKPQDSRVVLKLDDEEIYYDYFRYVFMNTKRDMDGGDASYWQEHPEGAAELKESVMETLLHYRAIRRLAAAYDIRITKAQRQAMKAYIAETKAAMTGGEEEYLQSLEEAYMSEYMLYYMQEVTQLWSDLYDYVTDERNGVISCSDEILDADIPQSFRRIRYVYIEKNTEDPAASKALAESVYEKAQAGEDFCGLVEEYGEDPDMDRLLEDGYYYTLGAIDEKVQLAVEALEEGALAPLVTVTYGYYVVQRLPLEQSYIEEHYEMLRAQYCARVFNEMLTAETKKVSLVYEELYEQLTLETMR